MMKTILAIHLIFLPLAIHSPPFTDEVADPLRFNDILQRLQKDIRYKRNN